jgi:hypothetical protein
VDHEQQDDHCGDAPVEEDLWLVDNSDINGPNSSRDPYTKEGKQRYKTELQEDDPIEVVSMISIIFSITLLPRVHEAVK